TVPSTVLNATLTSPSRMAVLSHIAKGNLPAVLSWDVCARTYGGLGADSSRTISHWGGAPSWVIATDQPAGSVPGTPRSKRTACAEAVKDKRTRLAPTIRPASMSFANSSLKHRS